MTTLAILYFVVGVAVAYAAHRYTWTLTEPWRRIVIFVSSVLWPLLMLLVLVLWVKERVRRRG